MTDRKGLIERLLDDPCTNEISWERTQWGRSDDNKPFQVVVMCSVSVTGALAIQRMESDCEGVKSYQELLEEFLAGKKNAEMRFR